MNLNKLKLEMKRFINDEGGLTTVEYAIAGGLVSLLVVTAFSNLGTVVLGVITDIATAITG